MNRVIFAGSDGQYRCKHCWSCKKWNPRGAALLGIAFLLGNIIIAVARPVDYLGTRGPLSQVKDTWTHDTNSKENQVTSPGHASYKVSPAEVPRKMSPEDARRKASLGIHGREMPHQKPNAMMLDTGFLLELPPISPEVRRLSGGSASAKYSETTPPLSILDEFNRGFYN